MKNNASDPGARIAQRRVWVLLLMDAAERADLTPMSSNHFHRMAFLSNTLSPIYDVPVADGEILKYRRGPFYPDLQWDLDRLAMMGKLHLSNLRHVLESDQEPWFYADYAMSRAGVELVADVVAVSPAAHARHQFYLEVAGAYVGMSAGAQEDAALQDANYRHPDARLNTLIDFADVGHNFSVRATQSFQRFAPAGIDLSDRDRLHLYFRYLNRMVERAAG